MKNPEDLKEIFLTLNNIMLKKHADYGPMNYGTNEAVAITMNLSYDNANQTGPGGKPGGIGEAIARTVNDVATGIATPGG